MCISMIWKRACELGATEEEYVNTALFPDEDADQYFKPRYDP